MEVRILCARYRWPVAGISTSHRFVEDVPSIPRRKYSVLPALLAHNKTTTRTSPFDRLTTRILRAILLRLHSANYLCICAVVSSAWKCAVDDEALWHQEARCHVVLAMRRLAGVSACRCTIGLIGVRAIVSMQR